MSELTEPLRTLKESLHDMGYSGSASGVGIVIQNIKILEAERDQLKKDLSCSDFELNMATSQLDGTIDECNRAIDDYHRVVNKLVLMRKELAECKKDLLKLLPIAHCHAEDCLNEYINNYGKPPVLERHQDGIDEHRRDLSFINYLTAKYAENIKPELKRVDCDGVGDNNGFFELKVGEYPEGNEEFSAQVDKVINDKLNGQVDGWLPIESAPRDGTHILILCPNDRICVAFYDEKQKFIVGNWHVPVPCLGGFGHGSDTVIHSDEDLPTHWMPLPKPPEKEGE